MQTTSVPRLGPLYWATLASASVFGTNTGDIISHTMHLGDDRGLPYLLLAFLLILAGEHSVHVANTIFYWLAIIVVRTAATNIADLATLQFEFDYDTFIAVLVAILVVVVATGYLFVAAVRGARPAQSPPLMSTRGTYWLAMLTAATLGTALGDFGAHVFTLRLSVLVYGVVFAIACWLVRETVTDTALYWGAIVVFRAEGTNVGDLIAYRKGLNLGLPMSSLLTGLVFVAFVLVGNRQARRNPQSAGV